MASNIKHQQKIVKKVQRLLKKFEQYCSFPELFYDVDIVFLKHDYLAMRQGERLFLVETRGGLFRTVGFTSGCGPSGYTTIVFDAVSALQRFGYISNDELKTFCSWFRTEDAIAVMNGKIRAATEFLQSNGYSVSREKPHGLD